MSVFAQGDIPVKSFHAFKPFSCVMYACIAQNNVPIQSIHAFKAFQCVVCMHFLSISCAS